MLHKCLLTLPTRSFVNRASSDGDLGRFFKDNSLFAAIILTIYQFKTDILTQQSLKA